MDLKINLSETLISFDGKEITDQSGKSFTIRNVMIQAVMRNEEKEDGKKKLHRFELAKAFNDQEDYQFNADDLKFIRDEIAKIYSPLIVGPALTILGGS